MVNWFIGPAGYQSSGETKSISSNGRETTIKVLMDKTEFVSIWKLSLENDTTAAATVYKGSMNYDASGQLTGGAITEAAVYLYNYSTQQENNQFWRFSGGGYSFSASTLVATTLEAAGASLTGFYSSDTKYNKYSDWIGEGSRYGSFPTSHSRDSIANFPDSSAFPLGWWNDPFSLNFNGNASTQSTTSSSGSTNSLSINKDYSATSVINSLLGTSAPSSTISLEISDKTLTINASSWSGSIKINLAAKASDNGDILTGKQIDFNSSDTLEAFYKAETAMM